MTEETISKDSFFAQLAKLSDEMIAAYDKEFAMGALILAARYIAEGEARAKAAAEASSDPDLSAPQPSPIIQ
jgi:hypothetical protein